MHIFSLVKLFISRQFQPIGVQMRLMCVFLKKNIKANAHCKIRYHHNSDDKETTQPSQRSMHNIYRTCLDSPALVCYRKVKEKKIVYFTSVSVFNLS